jgi:hypothetical protein
LAHPIQEDDPSHEQPPAAAWSEAHDRHWYVVTSRTLYSVAAACVLVDAVVTVLSVVYDLGTTATRVTVVVK